MLNMRKLLLFFYFIIFPAICGATQQIIVGSSTSGYARTSTTYCSVTGISVCASTELNAVRSYLPMAGTISSLYVGLATAPGAGGNMYTFTLMKNGVATALTCFATGTGNGTGDTNKFCSDLGHPVSVSATDLISIKIVPFSNPALQTSIRFGIVFTPNIDGQTIIMGGTDSVYASTALYTNTVGGTFLTSGTENDQKTLFATSGMVSNLYIISSAAPGSGQTRTFTMAKNSSAQALSCSMPNNTICSDTSNSFSVLAGDFLDLQYTATASSVTGSISYGFVFTPSHTGDFLLSGITGSNLLDGSTAEYLTLNNSNNFLSTEIIQQSYAPSNFVIKDLYVNFGTAPGGGAARQSIVRLNSANTNLSVNVSESNTSANVSSLIPIIRGDKIAVQVSPSGSPASSNYQYSILCNNTYTNAINGESKITGTSLLD